MAEVFLWGKDEIVNKQVRITVDLYMKLDPYYICLLGLPEKVPQTESLKQQKFIFLTVLKAGSDQGISRIDFC